MVTRSSRDAITFHARHALLGMLLLSSASNPALAHPIHTTLAELSYDRAGRTIGVTLRVFADDFTAAVLASAGKPGQAASPLPSDSAMFRYVRDRFAIVSPSGLAAPMTWCGVRRSGDVLFLCLRAASTGPTSGAKVRSALLNEVFSDQVNMVQVHQDGKRRMLLFTRRDGAKSLD